MTDDNPIGPSAAPPKPFAWQPLTPRGAAAFGPATVSRLLLVEFLVATLAAAAVIWFLSHAWFPAVRQAIQHIPEEGAIHNQELDSPVSVPLSLAESRPFILFVLDPQGQRNASQTSDVVVEFHKRNFQICSIFGCLLFPYPREASVEFTRTTLAPRWEAWEPALLGLAGVAVMVLLFVSWTVLATLYCVMVRLLGFFKDRDLNWRSSWRLASASLMPGALLLTAGIVGYGLGLVDLIRLLLLFLLHFVVGWVYVAITPIFVPRLPILPPRGLNPFASSPEASGKPDLKPDEDEPR